MENIQQIFKNRKQIAWKLKDTKNHLQSKTIHSVDMPNNIQNTLRRQQITSLILLSGFLVLFVSVWHHSPLYSSNRKNNIHSDNKCSSHDEGEHRKLVSGLGCFCHISWLLSNSLHSEWGWVGQIWEGDLIIFFVFSLNGNLLMSLSHLCSFRCFHNLNYLCKDGICIKLSSFHPPWTRADFNHHLGSTVVHWAGLSSEPFSRLFQEAAPNESDGLCNKTHLTSWIGDYSEECFD